LPLISGTRLGSYEVISAIGAGGMGEVYRARDSTLHRDVAIKVLPEIFAVDPEPRVGGARRQHRTGQPAGRPVLRRAAFSGWDSPPRALFDGIYNLRAESGVSYDVHPKGNRFLMIRLADQGTVASSIRVITNWSQELARLTTRAAQ
jgi:serine/threonine protein kinase